MDILINLLFTSLMCSLSNVKEVCLTAPEVSETRVHPADFVSAFKALSVVTLGGGPEERGGAQIRPPLHGAACLHRGIRTCARRLSADGARHGGGQEVPVSCEFVHVLSQYIGRLISSTWSLCYFVDSVKKKAWIWIESSKME